jgi:outer membrane protein OmpA-like peptidoglycan-associated protein
VSFQLDSSGTATDYVRSLIGEANKMEVKGERILGSPRALAKFTLPDADCCFFSEGLIISTGNSFDVAGPNRRNNSGVSLGVRGRNHLARMARNVSMDASLLQFDFQPRGDSLEFEFIFASEEYPEFVNRGVNDVFVFMLTDMESNEVKNLATVPGTLEPISIDNINHRRHHRLYRNNEYWSNQRMDFWQQNKELALMANVLQFDGYTVPLKASAKVVPGRWYKMSLEISDIGDGMYDSAVFLKAGSFTDDPAGKLEMANLNPNLNLNPDLASQEWLHTRTESDTTVLELQLYFEHDEYELVDTEVNKLKEVLDQLRGYSILVKGHTDDQGEESYNKVLSERRASQVVYELRQLGIDSQKLSSVGRGEYEPLEEGDSDEVRAKNRRVELWLFN